MSILETVLRADHLWPGDRFRQGERVLQAHRIAVTPGAPVAIDAHETAGLLDMPMQLSIGAGEMLRIVPP